MKESVYFCWLFCLPMFVWAQNPKTLEGNSAPEWFDIQKRNVGEEDKKDDITPPLLRIESPEYAIDELLMVSESKLKIQGKVQDTGTGVLWVKVKITTTDNKTIETGADISSVDKITDERNYSTEITLRKGRNTIQLSASDVSGNIKTMDSFIVEYQPLTRTGTDYAIIFANKSYEDQMWQTISNVDLAANKLKKELQDYGFEVKVIKDATLEQMDNVLNEYHDKKYKPDDQLLVFYAGHGHQIRGSGYLVAKDSEGDREGTYLPHERLKTKLIGSGCHHILLIMDACYSSMFNKSIEEAMVSGHLDEYNPKKDMGNEIAKNLKEGKSMYYISASEETKPSGASNKLSRFSQVFYDALRDGRRTGYLNFEDLRFKYQRARLNPTPTSDMFVDLDKPVNFWFVFKN